MICYATVCKTVILYVGLFVGNKAVETLKQHYTSISIFANWSTYFQVAINLHTNVVNINSTAHAVVMITLLMITTWRVINFAGTARHQVIK